MCLSRFVFGAEISGMWYIQMTEIIEGKTNNLMLTETMIDRDFDY